VGSPALWQWRYTTADQIKEKFSSFFSGLELA
jgi:hypothetical protein